MADRSDQFIMQFYVMPSDACFFVEVILPVPIQRLFTYRIPLEMLTEIKPGKRVIVQFGPRRFYSAVAYKIHQKMPEGYTVKDVISVLDDKPIVNSFQIQFWEWIASYYMCSLGEVMKAALPSGLKLESETKVHYNPSFEKEVKFSASEEIIMNLMADRMALSVLEIAKVYKKNDLLKIIKHLVDTGALVVEESIKKSAFAKRIVYIDLAAHLLNENILKETLNLLAKAPKQLQLLMQYIQLSGIFTSTRNEVSKKKLFEGIATPNDAFKSLIRKNIFIIYEKIEDIETTNPLVSNLKPLSTPQEKALAEVRTSFETKNVTLLHGYTASGKTELYIHLIDEQLKAGKQVLYLLPEIALTAQIINRLKEAFGEKVGIYHSKFSDADRVNVWKGMIDENNTAHYQIILGVRSSILLPFSNLGLVIVDEEHENSYKQFDPAPRYNARDASIILAQLHQAKVLLGTATPCIETYFNASSSKYGLVELFERFSQVALPQIDLLNIADARARKQMNSIFHPHLIEAIKESLAKETQVILFQNRRGFAPYIQCSACQTIAKCINCDVSLTYHKHLNQLICHYCGYATSKINHCEACGSETMLMHGFGTEKIEDELALFFPGSRIARLDLDSARSRKTYEKIISDYENQELDILVGTQMISKGLDFDNVSLVGILDADQLLNLPDFRAYERSFQLMSQVSGRAGRKEKQGKVLIQTTDVKNSIIHDVMHYDFMHMYQTQMAERQMFNYPPFTKLLRLTIKHKNKDLVDEASEVLAQSLRKIFGSRISGPEYPVAARINNFYLKNILIKIERKASMVKAKKLLRQAMDVLISNPKFTTVIVQPDIDPM